MSFQFEEGKMYMMPVVFGPAVTPRQNPEGGRWIYDKPGKTTHYKVVCEVSAGKLETILPDRFELLGPYVVVTFSALRELAWLAGGGYDILHIEVPVHFKGERDDISGFFEPVLWEDVTDAILTGREQLGYSKIFGAIETMTEKDGVARGRIATHGFQFLEMVIDLNKQPEDIEDLKNLVGNAELKGKLHYKYMPRTGKPFDRADAQYVCFGAGDWDPPADVRADDCPPAESWFGRGELLWRRPEWKDAPTQAHIIQFLCDMGLKRYVGAQKTVVHSHNDVYSQRILY